MKRSQAFPSRYLGKDDVQTPLVLTIKTVVQEGVQSDGREEDKAVMYFADRNVKPMVLNNTNWITCEGAWGDESDAWSGHQIEVYFDPTVMYGKERIGGVRLRLPQQARPASAPTSTSAGEATLAAQTAAWKAYQAQAKIDFPDIDIKAVAELWKAALKTYFPGKSIPGGISLHEWQQIVVDKFQRPAMENPIPDSGGIPESDIPF